MLHVLSTCFKLSVPPSEYDRKLTRAKKNTLRWVGSPKKTKMFLSSTNRPILETSFRFPSFPTDISSVSASRPWSGEPLIPTISRYRIVDAQSRWYTKSPVILMIIVGILHRSGWMEYRKPFHWMVKKQWTSRALPISKAKMLIDSSGTQWKACLWLISDS